MTDEYRELETLLEIREDEEEAAREQLGNETEELERRRRVLQEERAGLTDLVRERRRECRSFDERRSSGGVSFGAIEAFESYIDGLRRDERRRREAIERAREAIDAQQARVEEARRELADAVRQLEAVQKHCERLREQQRAEGRRKRAEAMDEVAVRVWRDGGRDESRRSGRNHRERNDDGRKQ